jgi:hypothetical protein
MVKTMIKQRSVKDRSSNEPRFLEKMPSFVYHQLADGRMAPVVSGGLVELALSELGARLVDVADERKISKLIALN